ncbi:DUF6702 family protein [Adhaeribacter pallidiroseus]|uniref:Uncharacterized protein n=1 Tax=Adhaeribacter pallidiroseus TaxID=2072847 RepID=A0A369QDE8_9BACT|nr:DUF6702 family protein [Adhaeribacter pallidiroseus]RDC62943.1 hypothetical protein AHMF7616_01542 [Adhaeribacter pallidiroseus]
MLSFIIILLLHVSSGLHPFFVSITEIRQNEKTKNLEVSSRIFFDDLEKTLEKKYKVKVNILKPENPRQVNELIASYLQERLQIRVNGKLVKLKYLGFEIEEEAAWCYLEAPQTTLLKRLDIEDAILFDAHPLQQNMVHVTVGNKRLSTKLDNPESRYTFQF